MSEGHFIEILPSIGKNLILAVVLLVALLIVGVIQELNSHHLKELAYLQYGFLMNYKIIVCFVLYVELAG
jgi:hypothetical protein